MAGERRQIVITRVGGSLYGIDIGAVHEIIPVPDIVSVPKSPANILGIINVRSVVMPVADLRACLGHEPAPLSPDARIVLVSNGSEKLGLVVDAVTEVTTLNGDAFQSVDRSHANSSFVRAVVRFEDNLVIEITTSA